jgi:hypothetical protein
MLVMLVVFRRACEYSEVEQFSLLSGFERQIHFYSQEVLFGGCALYHKTIKKSPGRRIQVK